jgi:serine/threonine protein kinase
MGQVYLGRSVGGRPVAVKLIRSEYARRPQFRVRFAREVEAARRVGGHYTAQVVAADPQADPPWMVTAYVPGPSLQEAVKRAGPLPLDVVQTLGAGLAEGLAAIHACGVVHRDVKPENVILAPDGPRVIDFGIARALDANAMTAHGEIVGTWLYMSPEQARGEAVESPGDVFSFGSVLTFAATGHSPFGAESDVGVQHRITSESPDLSGVPAQLLDLITACLKKAPADRITVPEILSRLADTSRRWPPPTVVDLINSRVSESSAISGPTGNESDPNAGLRALPTAYSSVHGGAGPASPPSPAPRRVSRRGVLLTGLGVVAGAATAAAVVSAAEFATRSGTKHYRANPQPSPADPNVLTGHTAAVSTVAFSRDGRTLASSSEDHTIRLWDLASRRTTATLSGHSGAVTSVAFSPDLKTLASGSADRTVRLWDFVNRRTIATLSGHTEAVTSVAFAPNGVLLASGSTDQTARLWVVPNRQIRSTLRKRPAAVNYVTFGPDGSVLMTAYGDNTVGFWSTSDPHDPGVLTINDMASVTSLAVTPDLIAVGGSPGWVSLWNGHKSVGPALKTPDTVNTIAFAHDKKTLAVGTSDGKIMLWDTHTHKAARASLTGHTSTVTSVAFSPDGKLLASGSADRTVRLWKI